jgi:histone acetyltransferase (RNA polymerase elongator complex component)
VHARLEQFELLGHRVDKVELIVMGGTMTARPPEYQEQFVSRCIEAMNKTTREEVQLQKDRCDERSKQKMRRQLSAVLR